MNPTVVEFAKLENFQKNARISEKRVLLSRASPLDGKWKQDFENGRNRKN
jgi:hypothetical protein